MLPHARCMAAYPAQQQHGVVWVVASSDDVHVWQGMMGQLDQAVEKAVGQKEKEMLQSRERLMREMEGRLSEAVKAKVSKLSALKEEENVEALDELSRQKECERRDAVEKAVLQKENEMLTTRGKLVQELQGRMAEAVAKKEEEMRGMMAELERAKDAERADGIELAVLQKEQSMLAERGRLMEEAAAKLAAVEEEEADDAARIGILQAKVAALEEKCRHDVEVAVAKKHESMMQQRRKLLGEKDAVRESEVAQEVHLVADVAMVHCLGVYWCACFDHLVGVVVTGGPHVPCPCPMALQRKSRERLMEVIETEKNALLRMKADIAIAHVSLHSMQPGTAWDSM